ncbi:MAG: SAM-dependent methyltransferase [Pseudomonadota bacterium]
MTPLAARLIRQIEATGPIPVSSFMALCLTDPDDGYYTTRDPFGAAGDFVTAPEISQMFGEMLGLWIAQTWDLMGQPSRFVLAELGPGRGTLMADVLRAAGTVPGFAAAAEVWFVEASPTLRAAQRARVPGAHWVEAAIQLPDGPLITLGNEFFDALPIRQYIRADRGWSERMVGVSNGALSFGQTPPLPDPRLDARFGQPAPGTMVETCPAAEAVVAELAARNSTLLAIDYGAWDGTGDTLQALQNHGYAEVLSTPGQADLTAHVNFGALARSGAPLKAQFTTQGAFLDRLGMTARAQALARKDPEGITAQHRRLTHPDEMGALFKVLALSPPDTPPLPGFAPTP